MEQQDSPGGGAEEGKAAGNVGSDEVAASTWIASLLKMRMTPKEWSRTQPMCDDGIRRVATTPTVILSRKPERVIAHRSG